MCDRATDNLRPASPTNPNAFNNHHPVTNPIRSLILISLLINSCLFAAPPTAEDDKAIAGSWQVGPPNSTRIYEITEGRTVKISGGKFGDKRGRMMPQEDGSYLAEIDGGVLRLVFIKPNDQLLVDWYASKDDFERALPPMWKSDGKRYKKP